MCVLGGVLIAAHHPLWVGLAWVLLWAGVLSAALVGGIWLLLLPAALPLLNFSPWTGWHVFEEFDILFLGSMAGAYLRLARHFCDERRFASLPLPSTPKPFEYLLRLLRGAMLCSLLVGLWLGIEDAGGWRFDWFAGYVDPLNSIRIFKAGALSFLFIPLLNFEISRNSEAAQRLLGTGVIVGLTGTVIVLLYERIAYPGLLEFSVPYRTVALFWEMHLGGAAIDAYLVLTAPFAIWMLITARRRVQWFFAAVLILLCVYAWLTTFSRGVYVAVAVAVILLGWGLHAGGQVKAGLHVAQSAAATWRRVANRMLMLLVVAEIIAVMVGSAFLRERMSDADRDWGGRIRHWEQGIGLLDAPSAWLLGKGLGRFPANYSKYSSEDEFSGSLQWFASSNSDSRPYVRLLGPKSREELAGRFRLTQRLGRLSPADHAISLRVRSPSKTELLVSLCEKHLLYEAGCQRVIVQTEADSERWQSISAPLAGPELGHTPWYAPRFGELSIAVANVGGGVDIEEIQVQGLCEACGIRNADFSHATSHWFYSGKSYFLPWHIDNLYLEVLIEQGAVGLLLFCLLISTALYCLLGAASHSSVLSLCIASAIFAASLLGVVSSFIDMPRVSLLFWLFLHFGHESRKRVR